MQHTTKTMPGDGQQVPGDKIDFSIFGKDGKEFERIHESGETYKGKWSWGGFLLGWIWCLLKGCWGYGLVSMLSILITYRSNISLFIGLGWCLLFGRSGTWLIYNVKTKHKQFPKLL